MEFGPKNQTAINYSPGEQRPLEDAIIQKEARHELRKALGETAKNLAKKDSNTKTDFEKLPTAG